jgi:ketosteroid isomerase-like protein
MRFQFLLVLALAAVGAVSTCAAGDEIAAPPAMEPIHVGSAGAAAAPKNDLTAELIQAAVAADIQRTAALVAADTNTLDQLCGDELIFGHADGRIHSKAELLDALNAGEMRYFAINPGPREVRLLAEAVALVFGSAELLVGTADDSHQLKIRYLAVYRRDARLGWRLTAYQSARRTAEE